VPHSCAPISRVQLEGGRYGWGEATAALEVVTLEDGLGLCDERDDGNDDADESGPEPSIQD
jgi:hypothetical protein